MQQESDDLRLLRVDIETIFEMSPTGRILRQNYPDRSEGPCVFFAGCPDGNLTCVRCDVNDRVTARVLDVAAKEPAWRDADETPGCVSKIAELLSAHADAVSQAFIYELPHGVRYEHHATIVRGDSSDGRQLLARLAERGMPAYVAEAGFKSPADFWEPWCVALDGDDIASMAYAARLGDRGAEIGVYTFPKYRRRGLAAAVTASWASMSSLKNRALFYSTSKSNRSSQRVVARLGLRRIGASCSVG